MEIFKTPNLGLQFVEDIEAKGRVKEGVFWFLLVTWRVLIGQDENTLWETATSNADRKSDT